LGTAVVNADASGTAPPTWREVSVLAATCLTGFLTMHREIWTVVDPYLADICRRRMAQLLGAPDDAELVAECALALELPIPTSAEITDWPHSECFDAAARAALAFAEQMVIDVGGVNQAMVNELLAHMNPAACYKLVYATWLFEAALRARLVLDLHVAPETLGLVVAANAGAQA
jgi:alkylhydroperoxidase family enzyme